jgi:hypothetical protein
MIRDLEVRTLLPHIGTIERTTNGIWDVRGSDNERVTALTSSSEAEVRR